MTEIWNEQKFNQSITTENVECKMVPINGQMVILDRDVTDLYGVETKRINEAVKNNPDKFPEWYVIAGSDDDSTLLRSNLETQTGRGKYSKLQSTNSAMLPPVEMLQFIFT